MDVDEIDDGTKLTLFDQTLILLYMEEVYSKQLVPTIEEIFTKLKDELHCSKDVEQFRRQITSIGFSYIKTSQGMLLMEDPKFTFERRLFLKYISKYRETKAPIYYIDERIFDIQTKSIQKPDFNKQYGKDTQFIFYIISNNGLLNGYFCNVFTEEEFKKWVSYVLFGLLPASSLVVMDRSPIHGKPVAKTLTRYHPKLEMFKWLMTHNVPCDIDMSKAELYTLIEKFSIPGMQYNIDTIFQGTGHQVVRLPSNLAQLSPCELMWKDIQESEGLKNVTSEEDLLREIKNLNNWDQYFANIEKLEKELMDSDKNTEKHLEEYVIDMEQLAVTN